MLLLHLLVVVVLWEIQEVPDAHLWLGLVDGYLGLFLDNFLFVLREYALFIVEIHLDAILPDGVLQACQDACVCIGLGSVDIAGTLLRR